MVIRMISFGILLRANETATFVSPPGLASRAGGSRIRRRLRPSASGADGPRDRARLGCGRAAPRRVSQRGPVGQLAAEGLGQQALVEPVEQMRGPGGLGGEPVDAGYGGFAADGC